MTRTVPRRAGRRQRENDGICAAAFRLFRFGRSTRYVLDVESTEMRAATYVLSRDRGHVVCLLSCHVVSRRSFRGFDRILAGDFGLMFEPNSRRMVVR